MKKFRFPVLLLCILSVITGSCRFYRVWDPLPVSLPNGGLGILQGSLPIFWNISWLSADGSVGERRIREGDSLYLPIPREQPVIVAASPITPHLSSPFSVRPAGFVLAGDKPGPVELLMTWEHGFAADFLLTLARAGIAPEAINIGKFMEAIEVRLGDRAWNQDLAELSSELLGGDLWIYSFRISELLDVILPLPSGHWYSEYPPDLPLYSQYGSWSGELAVGLHDFVRPADGSVLTVSIDKRGDVTVFP